MFYPGTSYVDVVIYPLKSLFCLHAPIVKKETLYFIFTVVNGKCLKLELIRTFIWPHRQPRVSSCKRYTRTQVVCSCRKCVRPFRQATTLPCQTVHAFSRHAGRIQRQPRYGQTPDAGCWCVVWLLLLSCTAHCCPLPRRPAAPLLPSRLLEHVFHLLSVVKPLISQSLILDPAMAALASPFLGTAALQKTFCAQSLRFSAPTATKRAGSFQVWWLLLTAVGL